MKKTFISALILTALFTVTGCEDKEAKAMIEQQTQTIAQLTAENTQLKAEKEKAEKVIPAIFAEKDVIFEKVEKISEKIEEIDAKINEVSEGWKTGRMGKVDLTLIRLAVYEMLYEEDVPAKVAINEAVELAKQYGTDNSPSFVNGVLAKLV